jgi:hypothetical protein
MCEASCCVLFFPGEAEPEIAAFAYLQGLGDAEANDLVELEERQRTLTRQRKEIAKQLRNKKARDSRLMRRAAKDLSPQQFVKVASLKVASAAKAKAKAKAKAEARMGTP